MSSGVADKSETIDFEVLPPERKRDQPDLSRLLAWVLDDLFRIPGTNFRIGLDPIIGLIPGLGDGSATAMGSLLLIHGLRAGVPRIVLVRMALNLLINALGGALPVAGDVFSAWFKSNRRNYSLLEKHIGSGRDSTAFDWVFVCVLLGGILAVGIGISVLVGFFFYRIFSAMFGG